MQTRTVKAVGETPPNNRKSLDVKEGKSGMSWNESVAIDFRISGIDLFCGAGGLSAGLLQSGIDIELGIDVDPECRYPFEKNIGAKFLELDIKEVTGSMLSEYWNGSAVRLLAGCAPCQPFSPYRRGMDTSGEDNWPLLLEFARLIKETLPELVTMENVPRLQSESVFLDFVQTLEELGYSVSWRSCYGPDFGLPQKRRRLVLIGSRIGKVSEIVTPTVDGLCTVRDAIGDLPPLRAGQTDPEDSLHKARGMAELTLKRVKASKEGGSWEDWPENLRAKCHRRSTGATFKNVYARMSWDEPSPTITTLATNFGAGRFGHPDQDRAISLREAAILQGFRKDYEFVEEGQKVKLSTLGRLIGNAVPPPIGRGIGMQLMNHVEEVFKNAK